jgi:hypothetical protein
MAVIYADRAAVDKAFNWLERAYLQHDTMLSFLRVDPEFRNLRGDARYHALLVKLNLAE